MIERERVRRGQGPRLNRLWFTLTHAQGDPHILGDTSFGIAKANQGLRAETHRIPMSFREAAPRVTTSADRSDLRHSGIAVARSTRLTPLP